MRLQKYLAQAGVASRRASETIISAGRVSLNGTIVTTPGTSIDPATDQICLDGKPLKLPVATRTIMLNKPRGYICSAAGKQGHTVFELLTDIPQRLFTIGRLDKDSEGLLLLTSDGELANRLTHPRYGHTKTYEVTVTGKITDQTITRLNQPMLIDDYRTRSAKVTIKHTTTTKTTLIFKLNEGRNRQIRKMCELCSLRVKRLKRTHIQKLSLENLPSGKWRDLTPKELTSLEKSVSR